MTNLIMILLIIIGGLIPIIYTIRILNFIPLTPDERRALMTAFVLLPSGRRYVPTIDRYYKGGKWWKRSSWSNSPNGERGATVPCNRTNVYFSYKGDCDIDHSPFKRWMHHNFWFEPIPPVSVFSITIDMAGTLTIHRDLQVSKEL